MKHALLAMTIMVAAVLLSWFVQGVRRRKGQGHVAAHNGSVSAEAAGNGHGWFDGHSHSGDHGGAGDAGGSDGGGGDGGGGDSGGGGGSD